MWVSFHTSQCVNTCQINKRKDSAHRCWSSIFIVEFKKVLTTWDTYPIHFHLDEVRETNSENIKNLLNTSLGLRSLLKRNNQQGFSKKGF